MKLKQRLYALKQLFDLRRSGELPVPAPTSVPGKHNLLIGPANSAGQGAAWAAAANRVASDIHAVNMQVRREGASFGFRADQTVASGYVAHSRRWQRAQFQALTGFDGVLVESGLAPAGRLFYETNEPEPGAETIRQINELQDAGVRVGLIFHGSDIRDPDRHMREVQNSYFTTDPVFTERMRRVTQQNRRLIAETNCQVFVSTPDLLQEIPGAQLLPVVVDPQMWEAPDPPVRKPLRVLHIPSSTAVKGTDLIDDTLLAMQEAGEIEYIRRSGVQNEQMPALYASADVVLDQFRSGTIYGVAACEAMAAGRAVISDVAQSTRSAVKERFHTDLPIVDATHATLEWTLRKLIDNPDRVLALGHAGREFVRSVHSGEESGKAISRWLKGGNE